MYADVYSEDEGKMLNLVEEMQDMYLEKETGSTVEEEQAGDQDQGVEETERRPREV